ncbi:lytic murein transglycosylase [Geminicoccaceae bacterium 1502E]|nr:lytic murein transglycosylase [Geminicoccaceae bacterium 1502E]
MLAGIAALVLCLGAGLASAGEASGFDAWLRGFRVEARAAGISEGTLDRAFRGVAPIDRVVELDRRQPEGRMTFGEYRSKVLSEARRRKGAALMREHADLLERVRQTYGVPPQLIVALWGIESSFGEFKGRFPVVASLATLAFEGRRADFFRRELMSALEILEHGDISAEGMFGSWAGAMGQSQFMPSTYRAYAVDFDGDGRRDIWNSLPDIFASMANYLSSAGWDARYIWGREVRVTRDAARQRAGLDDRAQLAEWQRRGVRRLDGASLPEVPIEASLLVMDEGDGPSFLVYKNFRTLMVWNRSTYFALTVGLLADQLAAASS